LAIRADPKVGCKSINAKCETVHKLPTFRDAFAAELARDRSRVTVAMEVPHIPPLSERCCW